MESLCKSLKPDNAISNGIQLSSFAGILLHNVRSVYVGDIANAPWNNICMVCERFSCIMSSNTNVIIVKLLKGQVERMIGNGVRQSF